MTLVFTTTGSNEPSGISLKTYDNSIQFDSVWFKKNCLETVTDSEGIGNLGKFVDAWKNALSTNCRDLYKKFSDIYHVRDRTAPLKIPDTFAPKVLKWLGGKEELLKEASLQHITSVDNLYTQESTVFNPLRGKRPGAGGGASEETKKYVAELLQSSAKDCDFCNYKINTAQDPFERVESKYSVSVSNTFKVEKFHGLILLKHHNPLEINEEMLLDGMGTAQKWFHRAHLYDQQHTVPHIYWDTLPRASASQVHPHFHVALADHYYARWAHFQAAAKQFSADHNGEDYFSALNKIHSALGLAVQHGNASVIAYLTPSASYEIMLFSKEPCKDLFQLLFYCVSALRDDMELYAISAGMVFPKLIPSADGSDLPAIIRLLYRGPAEAMRADIDSLMLFGTVNVNVDPYMVINNIKKSKDKRRRNA
ncbi:hypothetical protein ACROYT_G033161 [Oculina patagonica]